MMSLETVATDINLKRNAGGRDLADPRAVAEMLHGAPYNLNVVPMFDASRAAKVESWTALRDKRLSLKQLQPAFADGSTMPGLILDRTTGIIMLEADGENAEAALEEYDLTPTLTVQSRRGLHRFYRVTCPEDYPLSSFYLIEKNHRNSEVEVKCNVLTSMPPQTHPSDGSFRYAFANTLDIATLPPKLAKDIRNYAKSKAKAYKGNTELDARWGTLLRNFVDAGHLDGIAAFVGSWRANGTIQLKCPFDEEHSNGETMEASAYLVTREAAGLRCHIKEHNLAVLPLLVQLGYAKNKTDAYRKLQKDGFETPNPLIDETRPRIRASETDLQSQTREALLLLANLNEPVRLLVRDRSLIRLGRDLQQNLIYVHPLKVTEMVNELKRLAWWRKSDSGKTVACYPPKRVAEDILSEPSENLGMPPLNGIVDVPVFRPDGSLLEAEGYDATTGLFYDKAPNLDIPSIPERPTSIEVDAAVSLFMDDLFVDFPFDSQASKAHALAFALLPFVRNLMRSGFEYSPTPLHLVEASAPGSGKGKLTRAALSVGCGQHAAFPRYTTDDEEMRKTISTFLLEAHPALVFDNVDTLVGGSSLASALTEPRFNGRILGKNESVKQAVTNIWGMTSNNAILTPDIARRSVLIRLIPDDEKPFLRGTELGSNPDFKWKHDDLEAWYSAHRGRLIAAGLTICKAWVVAGMPKGRASLGSYERWAEVMGGILDVASVDGFLRNIDQLQSNLDAGEETISDFVREWASEMPGPHPAKDLTGLALRAGLIEAKGVNPAPNALAKSLGRKLQKYRDTIVSGYRVRGNSDRNGTMVWRLEAMSKTTRSEAPARDSGPTL